MRAFRRRRRGGFADLAWEARTRRSGTPAGLRQALTRAASILVAAARADAEADRVVNRTDRRALTRRLAEYRDLAVLSHRAEQDVATVERQLSLLRQVDAARAGLAATRQPAEDAVTARSQSPEVLTRAVEAVERAAVALDSAVEHTQNALGDSAVRLLRTRTRGVYRLGELYVVPFVDSLGRDRMRRFDSPSEAKAFAWSLRIEAKAKEVYSGPAYDKSGASGGGGGGG